MRYHFIPISMLLNKILEEPTCRRGAPKPVPQLLNLCSRAQELRLRKPVLSRACTMQQEKPPNEEPSHHNWRIAPASHNKRKALEAKKTQHSQK